MISFIRIEIESIDSYENLKVAVPAQLIDDEVIKVLKQYLGKKCDEIQIEYPYYDSDYLSTYYIHYSQKLRPYEKLCCRLHILKKQEYYGYIVLRPTTKGTKIGKTFIKPELLVNEQAYLMLHKFKAHVVGNEMEIRSFPWKSQETDISVCAHTAAWTVIRYFGNKFRDYADATIGALVDHTKNDWGRKTPSLGLTPVQVSDLFKDYNFSPLILQRDKDKDVGFLDELIAYIESGIPMIGFLYPIKHAISIIGHGLVNYDVLDNSTMVDMLKDEEINVISHSKLIQDLYVMDDNCFPYRKMPVELPSEESDVIYGLTELEYAVVPLYRRMQLAYSEVYERFRVWRKEKVMNWEDFCICRIYITSANSLKKETMISENMNEILKDVILNMTLPRFVWCIDLAGVDNFKAGLTSGRIIIDTTAPTLEEETWLLRHDGEKIEFIDIENGDGINKNEYSVIETEIKPYNIYINNLKEVKPEQLGG
nr:hypothetical protein [uncultured Blautia sp.]